MKIQPYKARAQWPTRRQASPLFHAWYETAMVATTVTIVGLAMAAPAAADSTESLRTAVAAARPAGCGLRSDPIIDQAATKINATTDRWINNAARAVPETNALPVLKDLGYGGTKASILSGASPSAAEAIKATLIQGFKQLPDCSYKDFGVSSLYNAKKGMILTTVVLAA